MTHRTSSSSEAHEIKYVWTSSWKWLCNCSFSVSICGADRLGWTTVVLAFGRIGAGGFVVVSECGWEAYVLKIASKPIFVYFFLPRFFLSSVGFSDTGTVLPSKRASNSAVGMRTPVHWSCKLALQRVLNKEQDNGTMIISNIFRIYFVWIGTNISWKKIHVVISIRFISLFIWRCS